MLVGGYIGAAQNYRPLMDIGGVGNHYGYVYCEDYTQLHSHPE